MTWNRTDRIAVVTLVATVLALVAAWLVVPEFRKWIGLDKHEVQTQPEKKSISGIVVDGDTNQGIGQALITLVGRTEQYVTEDSGNFAIANLPPDSSARIRLRISKSGFQPLDTTVEPPVGNLVLALQKQR
jgi:hypothetical protein